MAGTAVAVTREHLGNDSEVHHLRTTINLLVDDVEALRAALDAVCDKLDADGGVTDTDYATTADVAAAADMTAYKVTALQ